MQANAHSAEPLVSVVYVSSGRHLERDEILEILRVSRRNNAARNITGLLAYKDGNFLQVLEGPPSSVQRVLESIERDPRHSGMIVLAKKHRTERLFPEWSMAYQDLKELSVEEAAAYSPFLDGTLLEEKSADRPDICFKLLLSFKKSVR